MEFRYMKRFAAVLALVLFVTGCSQTTATVEYTVTEEAKITEGMSNQPQASYWFPEDLLNWNFEDDEDAKYNVSTVALAERVDKKELIPSNDTQHVDFKVVALSIMNASTSGNVPRGLNTFRANVFSNWQYIDQLVYWGGSSGEGIIVPPSADVIDAAHKNGVPVLGTIFFPQTAHGGKIEWLDTFLEKDANGDFPIIDKLIEVADIYGFDGWFINQETDTDVTSFDDARDGNEQTTLTDDTNVLTKEHAALMLELITQFRDKTDEDFEIMWYDSMTVDGKMDWQNALTDENKDYMVDMDLNPVSDSMFLNFWWNTETYAEAELLKASREKANENKINPYDLYAGIDVQANGFHTPVRWNLFMDENGVPYTSLGLYVPSWTYFSTNNPDQFQDNEAMFWVNGFGDPRRSELPTSTSWPGISTFALEQTAITKLPFKTNFNVGNGYNYFIEGEKVSELDWNNRSMQDVMPTYRWIMDHEGNNKLEAYIDYADAYQGGNAIRLRGNLDKDKASSILLYATKVTLEEDYTFTSTLKATSDTNVKLVLGFEDGSEVKIDANEKIKDTWTTVNFDLKDAVGKVMTSIAYEFTSDEDVKSHDIRLGNLSILPKDDKTTLTPVTGTLESVVFDEEESNFAGIRLFWEETEDDSAYYEIYRINEDKSRSFIGATPANTHYINSLERNDDTNKTHLVIVSVDQFGKRSKDSETITIDWPDNSVPKANFTASRTLIAPGDKVTFNNASSSNTESVKWVFEGADIEESTDEQVEVTFNETGSYSVTLTATNAQGDTDHTIENMIVVTDDAKGDLKLLSLNADTEASSFVNSAEAPEFAVNGSLDDKWCAVGDAPHDITVDLGSSYLISEVYMGHAQAGGESESMNTRAYKIEISEDGKEFTQVVRVLNNKDAETVDTFAPTHARYVKVTVDKPTQGSDSAVRLYELQVFGLE